MNEWTTLVLGLPEHVLPKDDTTLFYIILSRIPNFKYPEIYCWVQNSEKISSKRLESFKFRNIGNVSLVSIKLCEFPTTTLSSRLELKNSWWLKRSFLKFWGRSDCFCFTYQKLNHEISLKILDMIFSVISFSLVKKISHCFSLHFTIFLTDIFI